ncbi:MAG: serine hydroxymethyltransferase [Acidimicrobiales bacterium]|jgi:glycine hydroxymethyltransferase
METPDPADPAVDLVVDAARIFDSPLAELDPEIAELISGELARQRATLDLVASESVPPRAVLETQGSILTAKYADGYPGHREYDTCDWVDEIETIAIERAKSLFGAAHANVQPYSGASANQCVLHALCEPGDPVLGWDFAHGGHPTHYHPDTFAGRYYDAIAYHVREDDRLVDMDEVETLAHRHRPKVIFAGWSCYSRFLDFRRFREICDAVGAYLVVDMAHFAGLVAAGLHPDPVGYADVCTMTVHKTLGGARGGAILCQGELAARVDAAVYPGEQGCPLPHVIAAKAVTFGIATTDAYRDRMERTVAGAQTIARALVAAEPRAGVTVVTGGTDVHQLLVDLAPSGREAWGELARLNGLGISANAIPLAYDAQSEPGVSGLRFGASALASRGFGPAEFEEVGALLADALVPDAAAGAGEIVERVRALTDAFPLYRFLD